MIESVLHEHLLKQNKALEHYLASYGDQMAIFSQEAPGDTDEGWDTESQYGRIVFALDLTDDTERKFSGTLTVDVMCEEGVQLPEEMEPVVRGLIDGYFFSTEEITIAAQWSASNYFTQPTEKVIGVTLTFGLLAFPKQTTIEPDPIALFNRWTCDELNQALNRALGKKDIHVIGYKDMEPAWKPTNDVPAIYWRLASIGPCNWIPDTYNCSWHTAEIHGHILAPDKDTATIITRMIDNILTVKRRLIFEDMSPLMVDRNIRVNLSSDSMRAGQITIDATYGLLRIMRAQNPIQDMNITERRNTYGN